MLSIVVDLEMNAYLGFSFYGYSNEQNDMTRVGKLNENYTYRGGNWYAYFTSSPCNLARFDFLIWLERGLGFGAMKSSKLWQPDHTRATYLNLKFVSRELNNPMTPRTHKP